MLENILGLQKQIVQWTIHTQFIHFDPMGTFNKVGYIYEMKWFLVEVLVCRE